MQPSSSGSEYLGKGWVSLNFDVGSDQNLTAYVKVNIRARADSSIDSVPLPCITI